MIPISITISRFRSFKEEVTFHFPKGSGLFFLWGENLEEPQLEANGSGKSSLWEALIWCLYGKTSRGLKAGDAANWDLGKGTSVEFDFEVKEGAGICTVIRTWKPNSWVFVDVMGDRHDLTKDETNPLDHWLGLGFSAFLQCIVISQTQPMFLDLKADQKAALFAEVMNLDRWLDHSRTASEKARDQDAITRKLERELADAEGRFDQLEGQDLESLHRAWLDQRARRLDDLIKQHESLIKKQKAAEASLKDYEAAERKARESYEAALDTEEAEAEALDGFHDEVVELARRAMQADLVLRDAVDRVEQIADEVNCHACGQKIPEYKHAQQKAAAGEALKHATEEARKANARVDAAKRVEAKQKEAVTGIRRKVRQALEVLDEASARTKNARREVNSMDHALDDLEEQAEQLEKEPSPYGALMEKAAQERGRLLQRMRSLKHQRQESEERHAIYGYWVRWFKEIRLEQIGEALTQLEVEVNSCLHALGLLDWEIRFDVDKESKSGSIQRGFTVTIQSPHNDRPVAWEAWSGGESQRLRIAAQQGLANLIRTRTATALNLEVWDEPTQWMSGQGVQDLLESLSQRSAEQGRQIWIVDHRSLGYGGFSGSAGAIKTEKGTIFDLKGLYRSGHDGLPEDSRGTTSNRPVDDGKRRRRATLGEP